MMPLQILLALLVTELIPLCYLLFESHLISLCSIEKNVSGKQVRALIRGSCGGLLHKHAFY